MSVNGGVHLGYAWAIIVGLGAGLAAGIAGALAGRALPSAVIEGFRGQVHGRRAAIVAAVIALLCVFTVPTAWAAVSGATPAPPPPPVPTPTYPGYTPSDPEPTATTSIPTSADAVQLTPSAASHPDASSVHDLLGRYYEAINTRDYAAWTRVVTSKVAADQPRAQWEENYSTSRDDQIIINAITTSTAGDALADVSFHSTQDPEYAPKDLPVSSICWRLTYPVDTTSGVIGPALRGTVRKSEC